MKKISAVLVSLLLCLTLIGCGHSKPAGMSDSDYEKGTKVVELADDVIDGKSDAEKVSDTISFYSDEIENNQLGLYTSLLGTYIVCFSSGAATSSEVIDSRNDVAKLLNMEER